MLPQEGFEGNSMKDESDSSGSQLLEKSVENLGKFTFEGDDDLKLARKQESLSSWDKGEASSKIDLKRPKKAKFNISVNNTD